MLSFLKHNWQLIVAFSTVITFAFLLIFNPLSFTSDTVNYYINKDKKEYYVAPEITHKEVTKVSVDIVEEEEESPLIHFNTTPQVDCVGDKCYEKTVDTSIKEKEPKTEKREIIVLTSSNSVAFDKVVTNKSVTELQMKLMVLSKSLPDNATIYLVLDTPGGSVTDGHRFIDTAMALPQEIKTLTINSMSMGFTITQALGERLTLPSSTFMAHKASIGGLSGQIDGELEVRLRYVKGEVNYLETIAATRMGMPLKEYKELIRYEFYSSGFQSVGDKVADKIVLAKCDDSLKGVIEDTIDTMFGDIILSKSKCPLYTGIVKIKFGKNVPYKSRKAMKKFFELQKENPKEFYDKFIKNHKYFDILR